MHKPGLRPLAVRVSSPGKAGHHVGTGPPAWEMIEPGRYMPRRIRGSFPGRELG